MKEPRFVIGSTSRSSFVIDLRIVHCHQTYGTTRVTFYEDDVPRIFHDIPNCKMIVIASSILSIFSESLKVLLDLLFVFVGHPCVAF